MHKTITPKGITLSKQKKFKIIHINDEITMETSIYFKKQLEAINNNYQKVIPIMINSTGGDLDALVAMTNALKMSRKKIVTMCDGNAFSAAAVLFCYGNERYACENCRFMIHDAASTLSGTLSKEEFKSESKELDIINKTIYEEASLRLGLHKNFFLKILKKNKNQDVYLSTMEAMKIKIVQYIGLPTFKTHIKISQDIIHPSKRQCIDQQ